MTGSGHPRFKHCFIASHRPRHLRYNYHFIASHPGVGSKLRQHDPNNDGGLPDLTPESSDFVPKLPNFTLRHNSALDGFGSISQENGYHQIGADYDNNLPDSSPQPKMNKKHLISPTKTLSEGIGTLEKKSEPVNRPILPTRTLATEIRIKNGKSEPDAKGVSNFHLDHNDQILRTNSGHPRCNYCFVESHTRISCKFRKNDLKNDVDRAEHPQKGWLSYKKLKEQNDINNNVDHAVRLQKGWLSYRNLKEQHDTKGVSNLQLDHNEQIVGTSSGHSLAANSIKGYNAQVVGTSSKNKKHPISPTRTLPGGVGTIEEKSKPANRPILQTPGERPGILKATKLKSSPAQKTQKIYKCAHVSTGIESVDRHQRGHTPQMPQISPTLLSQSLLSCCSTLPSGRLACNKCGYISTSFPSADRHQKEAHQKENLPEEFRSPKQRRIPNKEILEIIQFLDNDNKNLKPGEKRVPNFHRDNNGQLVRTENSKPDTTKVSNSHLDDKGRVVRTNSGHPLCNYCVTASHPRMDCKIRQYDLDVNLDRAVHPLKGLPNKERVPEYRLDDQPNSQAPMPITVTDPKNVKWLRRATSSGVDPDQVISTFRQMQQLNTVEPLTLTITDPKNVKWLRQAKNSGIDPDQVISTFLQMQQFKQILKISSNL